MSFISSAQDATTAMRAVFPPTPLMRNAMLSDCFGAEIYLKREDLSPVRSYKLRGAFNAMRKVPDQSLFVCASAGNHAQGVAFMCRHFGVKGVIFMPVTTPEQKIMKTRMFGGDHVDVRLAGDYFDDTLSSAQQLCVEQSGHFLSPFDDADVIEGQASVAVEIEEQLGGAPDHIVLPVGGGGLSAGIALALESEAPHLRARTVEPEGFDDVARSLSFGAKQTNGKMTGSVCDAILTPSPGDLTFPILQRLCGPGIVVSDEDALRAMASAFLRLKLTVEPGGAVALAAALFHASGDQDIIAVASGGNVDAALFQSALTRFGESD